MSWTKSIAWFVIALGASIGTATAGTIVVRSSGPSARDLPPGRALTGARLTLRRGDSVMLLDARGTRSLTGPGSFVLGTTTTAAASSAIGALIGTAGARQVRTGAVRGGAIEQAAAPSLWYVDTGRSGTMCLTDLSHITLWRKAVSEPVMLTLTRTGDRKSVSLSFSAGQSVRSWPLRELPVADGSEYRLSGPGLAQPTVILLAAIAYRDESLDRLGAALIASGCQGQIDLLVATSQKPPAG